MEFTHRRRVFAIEGVSEHDHIFKQIARNHNFYEEDLLRYLAFISKTTKRRGKRLAVDVGANIGNHSIFMRAFLSEHLIAIEPNPVVLTVLRKNLDRNIDNYTIYACGVGEREGVASIAIPDNATHNVGMAKLSFDEQGDEIRVKTLDSIIDKWQATQDESFCVSVIKIDVEGMELSVLKGAVKTIKKHKPHIFVEAATDEEYRLLKHYLKGLSYYKTSKWAATPVYHFAFEPDIGLLSKIFIYKAIRYVKIRLKRCFAGSAR